jgi:DNA-binding MarR family transcriptional regulator
MAMEPEARDPRRAAEAAVTDGVLTLSRAFRKAKARFEADTGAESAAWLLLQVIGAEGPMRASALAACVHSDLSTVSRQSGHLVAEGLLKRQADPADGRASLLALTPAGEQVRAEHIRIRNDFFADVLQGWTNDELAQFAGFLGRFAADHERTHAAHLDGAAHADSAER